jgi:hypothetical protein
VSPNAIANLIFGSGTSGTQYFNYVNYSGQRQADKKVLHITVTKQDDKTGTITCQLTTANSKLNSLFMYTTEFQANLLGFLAGRKRNAVLPDLTGCQANPAGPEP